MELNIKTPFPRNNDRPFLITGPCSAETEEQVLKIAQQMHDLEIPVDLFRAGIWKPRTRPNNFEGIGFEGLQWLKRVKEEFGYKITTEVANANHVFEALKASVDVLWLGARTTVNPFSVQDVADALRGVDVPVFIKNPINPDLKLWMGAIERIYNSGINRIGIVHRGFSRFGHSIYRNIPLWQIPIELKREFPDLFFICDASHICGSRETLFEVSQTALDLDYDGLMLESHWDPDNAWSDAKQQVTPYDLKEKILSRLVMRDRHSDNLEFQSNIVDLRARIDSIDKELIEMLANRMTVAEQIGHYKRQNNIAILQADRWNEIIEKSMEQAGPLGLSKEFVSRFLKAVHQESIDHQKAVMSDGINASNTSS